MGFSVSASAAIIFISFLMVATTLYTAWDNAYTNVQAAREYWYNLRLARLNTLVGLNASIGTYHINPTTKLYNVTFHIRNFGVSLYIPYWSGVYDGKLVTLSNLSDDNVGWLENYTYFLPGQVALINVTNINLDGTVHNLTLVTENGCWLEISWHDNGTAVLLNGVARGCPTEVG